MPIQTEQTIAEKEAFEYWGYLFKPDKTGTDKLKKLLRSLHRHIGAQFDPCDSSDLTPRQLARFYRELNGDYDQLFLSIPSATIAFIYKNLECLYSLQPTASATYRDPTIPALKVDGWIKWETIQLLLGPEEHAVFLANAVKKWELVDPDTGARFPNILPRACFPAAPDARMTVWYEGVSDRLRREAEEEASMRISAAEEDSARQIEPGNKSQRRHNRDYTHDSESDDVVEIRKSSALSYFRNPLFKNNEGRPGVVRKNSRHPTLMERGLSAASSVGYVVRSIGSPHLWDGSNSGGSKEGHHDTHHVRDRDRERDRDRDRSHSRREHYQDRERDHDTRRKSLPHAHHFRGGSIDTGTPSPRVPPRRSQAASPASDEDDSDYSTGRRKNSGFTTSPKKTPPTQRHSPTSSEDHTIRHSRSHDPTPSPRDYFPPYDSYNGRPSSTQTDTGSPDTTVPPERVPSSVRHSHESDRVHPGFMPTGSPLFATRVAWNDPRPSTHYGGPSRVPSVQGRERYDSPNRSPLRRGESIKRQDSARRPPNGSSPPGPYYRTGNHSDTGPPPTQQRPKVARFETPALYR